MGTPNTVDLCSYLGVLVAAMIITLAVAVLQCMQVAVSLTFQLTDG